MTCHGITYVNPLTNIHKLDASKQEKGAKKPHTIITNNKKAMQTVLIKKLENNANIGVLDHNKNKKDNERMG